MYAYNIQTLTFLYLLALLLYFILFCPLFSMLIFVFPSKKKKNTKNAMSVLTRLRGKLVMEHKEKNRQKAFNCPYILRKTVDCLSC